MAPDVAQTATASGDVAAPGVTKDLPARAKVHPSQKEAQMTLDIERLNNLDLSATPGQVRVRVRWGAGCLNRENIGLGLGLG